MKHNLAIFIIRNRDEHYQTLATSVVEAPYALEWKIVGGAGQGTSVCSSIASSPDPSQRVGRGLGTRLMLI